MMQERGESDGMRERSDEPSIYQRALGTDFRQLHPQIQRRFGLTCTRPLAALGQGRMDKLWHGRPFTLPFLHLGAWRSIMFPEQGRDVPFTIENFAYRDALGRDTVTWVRTFQTKVVRRFDAYMVWSEKRGCIVDYLGTHQHLAVDLELSVSEMGGLRLRSGEQRFYEGPVAFRFPAFGSGVAEVHEFFDDLAGCFRIEVVVRNPHFGPLFGYSGQFTVDWLEPGTVPARLLPRRTEQRE